ncbi:GDSL-type esterase/lipase family protein [Fictibacillus terranigra]|uniref:GDSL-type esterase/lipase family protein n=1 Tax=Fictibacillus terranigra TaxID=3058424 RepID=A0ABT8ECD7_9BACL|nr:GDSL-type esterase/lipase family protein [Fictibacillus sp. CENA-BCM004]MDN4075608.1 GDSL-type esterase/lipase family protein [Fictibacillus sp. CENA-BCM004]
MKKWIWLMLILFAIGAITAGGWYYYPQYKIDRLKAQNAATTESSGNKPHQEDVSYIQHLKHLSGKELHHLALGDSVIQGRGSNQGGFIKMANNEMSALTFKKVQLDNQGISGATSSDLLTYLSSPGMSDRVKSADIITINIGGNDLVKLALKEGPVKALQDYQNVKSTYEKNLIDIFSLIRKENPHAILVYNELYNAVDSEESFYPATKKLLNDWNLIAYETTSNYKPSVVIPSSEVLKPENRKEWIYDTIHPNEKGHERIARQMIKALKAPYKEI